MCGHEGRPGADRADTLGSNWDATVRQVAEIASPDGFDDEETA
jgi:hypothetical protein